MPQILVIADVAQGDARAVQMCERLAPALLESQHYAAQLLERVRWAAADAAAVEQREPRPGAARGAGPAGISVGHLDDDEVAVVGQGRVAPRRAEVRVVDERERVAVER
jgi:hypothetical protein